MKQGTQSNHAGDISYATTAMPEPTKPQTSGNSTAGQHGKGEGPPACCPAIGQRNPYHHHADNRSGRQHDPFKTNRGISPDQIGELAIQPPGKWCVDGTDQQHGNRRDHRQWIVRQLCRHQFDDHPEGQNPGNQKAAFHMRQQQGCLADSARQQQAAGPYQ